MAYGLNIRSFLLCSSLEDSTSTLKTFISWSNKENGAGYAFYLEPTYNIGNSWINKNFLKDFKHGCYNIKKTMDELKDRLNQSRPFNQIVNFLTLRIIK